MSNRSNEKIILSVMTLLPLAFDGVLLASAIKSRESDQIVFASVCIAFHLLIIYSILTESVKGLMFFYWISFLFAIVLTISLVLGVYVYYTDRAKQEKPMDKKQLINYWAGWGFAAGLLAYYILFCCLSDRMVKKMSRQYDE